MPPAAPFFPLRFFFNDPATTEIYTLSLHDALPIFRPKPVASGLEPGLPLRFQCVTDPRLMAAVREHGKDRKSTRLNSSHVEISYAVFCLKKKKKRRRTYTTLRNTPTHLNPPPVTVV